MCIAWPNSITVGTGRCAWAGSASCPIGGDGDVLSRCMGAQISGGWLYCAKTLKLCVSFAVLQCLARLRLGWHQLRVRTDRLKKAGARLPRNHRLCWLCSTDGAPFLAQRVGGCCVEDVKHFLLECPAYQHLRARYPCVFGDAMPDGTTQREQLQLLALFDCDQQDQLAHVVYTMTVFREHCLIVVATRQPYSDHQCPANCGGGCGVD
jgi:hypothetical protein